MVYSEHMTPLEVLTDLDTLTRFQREVAYRDGTPRSKRMRDSDTALLLSESGLATVAWLWPDQTFDPAFDPYDPSDERNAPDAVTWTQNLAARFRHFVIAASSACGRSPGDVLSHVAWTVGLSRRDMARLVEGHDHLAYAAGVCAALQLEFADDWRIVDPAGLGHRVDASITATRISRRLRFLTAENLANLERKLPKGQRDLDHAKAPESYNAPPPGGRYRALFELLASDERDSPYYLLDAIDRALREGGEEALPRSARHDTSWWAGTGTSAMGRPQLRAWWAAGYKIGRIEVSEDSGEVIGVKFNSLPGRPTWFSDADRVARGAYRMPDRVIVTVRPQDASVANLSELVPTLAEEDTPAPPYHPQAKTARRPRDREVQVLMELLEASGELDRAAIEERFDPKETDDFAPWMSNLLTRARRQGWTVRYGSKTKPRWVASGSKGDLMLQIANTLGFEAPHVGMGSEVSDEYLARVASALGVELSDEMNGLPGMAVAAIVEALGGTWPRDRGAARFDESLLEGLRALRDCVSALEVEAPPH
jgi:hypothetical protein